MCNRDALRHGYTVTGVSNGQQALDAMETDDYDLIITDIMMPVVPCFITMRDTDKLGADGFPVQEYTPHLGAPPVYRRIG